MNIKTQITFGFLAVLALLLAMGTYAHYTVQRLDRSSRTILKDNFYSVQLGQGMLQDLDAAEAAPASPEGLPRFGEQLRREAGNVTEPGEQPLVDSLTAGLARYDQLPAAAPARQEQSSPPRAGTAYSVRVIPGWVAVTGVGTVPSKEAIAPATVSRVATSSQV